MKKNILMFVLFIVSTNCLLGQNKSRYFVYETTKSNFVVIKPKNKVNTILSKGEATLGWRELPQWHRDVRVKPLQELIDEGKFSKERMAELKKVEEGIRISLYFDETGVVSYVSFVRPPKIKSILTEEELYTIYQKYMGVVYDLKGVYVIESTTGSKTIFYCMDYFPIPLKDLKY